jgi:coenzyme F420-reducing hydrogenase gamma subunit
MEPAMRETKRLKTAFFSFTCCEGCQLMVLSCEDELPDMLRLVNMVNFREAMTEKGEDYDVAFVEGSISRASEVRKLKKIRSIARTVVALGACSSTGGLNRLKNRYPMDLVKRAVYGRNAGGHRALDTMPVKPIDAFIKVDHYLHGCPIPKKEFLSAFNALVMGRAPVAANHPVCVDCKIAGNICVFEKGMTCLGPVTRAGCDAICVSYGCVCWGCRGLVDDPNVESHRATLERHGLTEEEALASLRLYGGIEPR